MKCLFEKLKETVNNNNIPYLDSILIKCVVNTENGSMHFNKSAYSCAVWNSGSTGQILIIGDGASFEDGSKTKPTTYNGNLVLGGKGAKFTLVLGNRSSIKSLCIANASNDYSGTIVNGYDKYAISLEKAIFNTEMDIDQDFSSFYIPKKSLTLSSNINIKGSITDIELPESMEDITLTNCPNITGDISNWVLYDALLDLNLYNMKFACNIEYLKVNKNIKNIRLQYNNNVYGTIEGFVATQRLNGITTGSIQNLNVANTLVTFDGARCSQNNTTLGWNNSSITYGGKTIRA